MRRPRTRFRVITIGHVAQIWALTRPSLYIHIIRVRYTIWRSRALTSGSPPPPAHDRLETVLVHLRLRPPAAVLGVHHIGIATAPPAACATTLVALLAVVLAIGRVAGLARRLVR